MSVVTDNAGLLELIVREIAANDPRCPYDAEACRTMPIDREYMRDTGYGKTATAILAAVAPLIAAAERERVAKWHDDQCQEATTRAEAAKAHGETGNVLHHARFAHAHWLSAAAIRALEPQP